MHNICVVTGTRAEYHILYPLIKRLNTSDEYILKLAVTGSHLSEKYGNTYIDIENDGFDIDIKIPILFDKDSASDINATINRTPL